MIVNSSTVNSSRHSSPPPDLENQMDNNFNVDSLQLQPLSREESKYLAQCTPGFSSLKKHVGSFLEF